METLSPPFPFTLDHSPKENQFTKRTRREKTPFCKLTLQEKWHISGENSFWGGGGKHPVFSGAGCFLIVACVDGRMGFEMVWRGRICFIFGWGRENERS